MNLTRTYRASRAGAVALGVCIILLPMAVAGALVVFQQLDIAVRETDRRELTTQSRMLIDAAIVLAQAEPEKDPWTIAGGIDEIGIFRIERMGITENRVLVTGELNPQKIGGHAYIVLSTLEAEWDQETRVFEIDSASEQTEYRKITP